jgi:uncharacterized protein
MTGMGRQDLPKWAAGAGPVALQLALGTFGGTIAIWAGLPMPWLLGALIASATAAIRSGGSGPFGRGFPQGLRRYFVAVVGVMIGQSFSPGLIGTLSSLWISLIGIAVFVVLAQGAGYLMFRRIGGHDPTTALFAAMPGGLIEAITIGERYGADVQVITLQHFARVILVVAVIPLGFQIWTGQSVGSAAGLARAGGDAGLVDLALTLAFAAAGIWLGNRLRLPAPILIGPLLLSATLHATALTEATTPGWLLGLAQLVIGTGLGASFSGIARAQLWRSFAMAGLSVSVYLVIGLGFAFGLVQLTAIPLPALIISFAPGGVTEMGLVALSLNLSPIIVAAHHVFRIALTVGIMTLAARRLR